MTKNTSTTNAFQTVLPSITPFINNSDTSVMNLTATSASQVPCGDPNALQSPLAVLYSIIFVLGLVGNLVALWVFFCVHSKKNSVRVFLINVAFADLLLVVCLPFRILYHSQGNVWNMGPTFCKVVGNLFYMNMYMSITLLGLISVDRYLKIHHGTRMPRQRSTKSSKAICAFIWIMAIGLTSVMLMSKNHSEPDRLVTVLIKLSYLFIVFMFRSKIPACMTLAVGTDFTYLVFPGVSTTSHSMRQSGKRTSTSFCWLSFGLYSSLWWCPME